jgi:hypothetical protein
MPLVQFEALDQFVLEVPVQLVVWPSSLPEPDRSPIAIKRNNILLFTFSPKKFMVEVSFTSE